MPHDRSRRRITQRHPLRKHALDRDPTIRLSSRKRRGKVFRAEHLKRLEQIFRSVGADFEVILKEFNGEPDHVHLLVNSPSKVRLSELVNSLKGVSSRRMKQEF
jgi:REP element-mobilizing transposase RayT